MDSKSKLSIERFSRPAGKRLAFQKKGPFIAIDIERDVVRLAEAAAAGAGKPGLARLTEAKLEFGASEKTPAPAQIGLALKNALPRLGARPKFAYMGVSRAHVVLRPIIVPNVEDSRELAAIVNFQIAKDLPFRIEDAVVDFKVLRILEPRVEPREKPAVPNDAENPVEEAAPEARLEVLVGAVKKEVVESCNALAAAAGFTLAGLGLRSSAYLRVLQACGEILEDSALIFVALRQDEITVEIIANEALALSRVINVPLPSSADSPAAMESFLNAFGLEVVRSLHSYDGMMWHKPVSKILVAGASGLESKVAETLATRLGLKASLFNPSLGVENTSSSLAPIGLSLAAQDAAGLPIDFIHPKKPAQPKNTKRTRIIMAVAAALVLMMTLAGIRARLMNNHNKTRIAIQEQLSDAEKKLPAYRKLKFQQKVVKGWTDEGQSWLDHLAYLTTILPPADQLYINNIATTSQRGIRFSVQAKTGELLSQLDKILRAAGYEVKPLSITPATDKYGYNFRTTVELGVPKKMKIDLQKASPPKRPEDDVPNPRNS